MSYNKFKAQMQKIADIEHSVAVLSWDKEVNLPEKGATVRARQAATLAGTAHTMFTDKKFGTMLRRLEGRKLSAAKARNVALVKKDFDRAGKFSEEFVLRNSRAVSAAYHAWVKAREANDYAVFAPHLAELVNIKREAAEIIGYTEHPYDALMDEFEPGYTAAQTDALFAEVREQLVDFAAELRKRPQVTNEFLHQHYAKDKQWDLGLDLLRKMGYDFLAGRQDISHHPFTITFGAEDVRVTTRIDEEDVSNMIWSCIHEGGHALYEQGLPAEEYGMPLGRAVSLGIHESQSRLWENNVGRSLAYWKANYADLQNRFPEQLGAVGLEKFWRGINRVAPNLIRTEADELHYHFHVMIRYEIEKGLIEGSLDAKNLNRIWNDKYREYLGIEVPDDRRGILQDIHWSHGSIGYFPTYSLGSFYAAQFFAQAQNDIKNLTAQIEKGDTAKLLAWLRKNIHRHGKMYDAGELCRRVTGEELNFKYFMDYIREKYSRVY